MKKETNSSLLSNPTTSALPPFIRNHPLIRQLRKEESLIVSWVSDGGCSSFEVYCEAVGKINSLRLSIYLTEQFLKRQYLSEDDDEYEVEEQLPPETEKEENN